MTLDIKKMILNAVRSQQKIHHTDKIGANEDKVNSQIFTKEELETHAPKATARIKEIFGATFLEDAELVLFFTSKAGFTKELLKAPNGTLFKTIDNALSKDANRLTEGDIKSFSFEEDEQVEEPETEEPEETAEEKAAEDEAPAEDAEATEEIGESVESPEPNEKFIFVKINLK